MAKNLYIIDGHAHIYASYFAPMRQQLTSPAGEPTKATYIFTTTLLSLINNQHPDMLVVAMDSKTPSFRKKIFPDYKAHRPPMPEDMPVQIERIEEILGAMKIPVFRLEGFEADDIIGTLAKRASADGIDAYICSKDKDMLQLIDERVCTFDIKTGRAFDRKSMAEEMKIAPKQFIDCLALQGDTADNIPGVPDVGPKTALDWIQKYGSLENIYDHADEIKGKRGDNLRKSKELALLSKELVIINCDTPIEVDYDAFRFSEPDKEKLSRLFTELGFTRLLSQMGLTASADIEQPASGPAKVPEGPASAKTVSHDYQLIDTPEKFDKFIDELKKQKIFAIDTETTSLNAMRADLVGMSFSWQQQKAFYLAIKAPLGTKHLDLAYVRKKLSGILADETVKKVGQNIKYDLLILRGAGIEVKGVYFDTMVASYCLDPERGSNSMDSMALDFLGYHCIAISSLIGKGKNQLTFDMVDTATACEYAAEDADITWQLYLYLKERLESQPGLKELFETIEMPLVPVLAQMEYNGVSLDTRLLAGLSGHIAEELDKLKDEIYQHTTTVFNIDSPKQLAEILFDQLGLKSTRRGKTLRSTNASVLEELSDQHAVIGLILQYRQLSKLQNTYVEKLSLLINLRTDRVHTSFNQTITATGRLSSSNPNLQNIPIRTELGRQIRSAFIPQSKTDCILSADYSQIELRLLAHFSKDKALLEAFTADRDIHRFVASQIYNVPLEEVTGEMRSHSKAVNFGIIYGQGAFGLSRTTGISHAQARKFIEDYFARYKSIRKFMDDLIHEAQQSGGYVETILGRRRKIFNLNHKNGGKRAQAERFVVNTAIQGSAADLIKLAMINIHRRIETQNLPVKLILQIHDELVFELPKDRAKEHAEWIADEMTTAIKLDVPLKVDVTIGANWLGEK